MRFAPLFPLLIFSAVTGTGNSTDLLYGHFEIHVDHAVNATNPDAGWKFSASYDEDDDFSTSAGVVRMDPAGVTYVAAPRTQRVVPSPAGVFSRFGPPGTPLWVLPQGNTLGGLYLGVRTTMPAGIFQASVGGHYTPNPQGSISLRLVSVTGSGPEAGGHFATWKTESTGTTVFSFDTTDGISGADTIDTIPVSSHTHYNWGFTKPGRYAVTLEAKGKLMPPANVETSARGTFHFAVPFSSRAGGGFSLRPVDGAAGLTLAVCDPADQVGYAPDQVMLEAGSPASAETLSVVPGALWQVSGGFSTTAAVFRNGVGTPSQEISAGLAADWREVAFEIREARGPGAIVMISRGAVAGNRIPLAAGGARDLTVAFKETGIHRVVGVLTGTKNGTARTSKPFTLTFGAGITAEFGYAAWQGSFEKTAGLPAGALADPLADHDGDGLTNGAEFALFWHGLDPAVADAGKLPLPHADATDGRLTFLRDTYKDPLDESRWQLRPSVSTDLATWQSRSSRVPGFPLGVYEAGAERGDAHGRILRRQLRLPGPQPRAFFRFSITTP